MSTKAAPTLEAIIKNHLPAGEKLEAFRKAGKPILLLSILGIAGQLAELTNAVEREQWIEALAFAGQVFKQVDDLGDTINHLVSQEEVRAEHEEADDTESALHELFAGLGGVSGEDAVAKQRAEFDRDGKKVVELSGEKAVSFIDAILAGKNPFEGSEYEDVEGIQAKFDIGQLPPEVQELLKRTFASQEVD